MSADAKINKKPVGLAGLTVLSSAVGLVANIVSKLADIQKNWKDAWELVLFLKP